MSGDQLEEYKKTMQARYGNRDEDNERRYREEQLKRDEELARKLAQDHPQHPPNQPIVTSHANHPPPAGYANHPPGYANNPPPPGYPQNVYSSANPSYPGVNQAGYYQQPYPPPPSNYYASEYNPAQNNRLNESQPLVQNDGFLPEVKDTCCYVNTQICVLTLAVLMIVGIITGVVVVAVS